MNTDYRISLIRELRDQQVRFAPRAKRNEQADRAETLLSELDPSKNYPYDFLFFRVTEVRPDATGYRLIKGDDAVHDLRLFVEDITDSMNLRVEEAKEPVHTVEDLSKMFNVSTKTISRWRDQGLVSRRFLAEGRKRVGFLHSSVDRFVTQQRAVRKQHHTVGTNPVRTEDSQIDLHFVVGDDGQLTGRVLFVDGEFGEQTVTDHHPPL